MGLFDFFKKNKINPKTQRMIDQIKERSAYIPTEREKMLFLDMVKGKRVEHIFYGNTSLIQEHKRGSLKKWLYDSVEDGVLNITSGNESISQSLSKKDLAGICANNGMPLSGNKIDLVNWIASKDLRLFDSFEISDWFLLTSKGEELLKAFKDKEQLIYDELQQRTYNLLLNNNVNTAIDISYDYYNSYPFNRTGFFVKISKQESTNRIGSIIKSTTFETIGFGKSYISAFKSVMCMDVLYSDVNVCEKFEEIMEGSNEFIKRSNLIKNKDLHVIDLRKILNGEKPLNLN